MATKPLLTVENLNLHFSTAGGVIKALNGISFAVEKGDILGIVGESGSGKSVTALSIMGLLPEPNAKITAGRILLEDCDLLPLNERERKKMRGNQISMIFQEPMTSLNPILTCGFQVGEALRLHKKISRGQAREQVLQLLKKVGIPLPEQRMKEYPHQLSGGMRQRVMIAMALACNPRLLIADEPTTALDVTIQAQVLELIKQLNCDTGTSIMMITHDLGVVAETCNKVIVMYLGHIVESADKKDLFKNPMHPYTRGLINSIPQITAEKTRLSAIRGMVPSAMEDIAGCEFCSRCDYAMEKCRASKPPTVSLGGHSVRCFLYEKGREG